ncbi:MAG: hypothetical protein U1E53_00675 [Dongiaceae bacterium]
MRTILLGGLLAVTCVATAAAGGIEGRYKVDGTNPDGSPYKGEAQIVATGGATCEIRWDTGGESLGICMRSGDTFAAAYKLGEHVGLVIYRIQADGSMSGTWTVASSAGVGTEVLTPEQ